MIVKVCGLRDPDNIRAVDRLAPDLAGFIFYDRSPRRVPGDDEHAQAVRGCRTAAVGVFVNAPAEEMLRTAERFALRWLQLHGDEPPETCQTLRRQGYGIIKAVRIAAAGDLDAARAYESCADYLLFDTRCAGFGGSGQRFDWSLLGAYTGRTPFLLSGGLGPDCADDLLRFSHPRFAGVDLNSGFETAPGMKDPEKLEKFIANIRQS